MARYWYAAHHTYGVNFYNDHDVLLRFLSKKDRDAFVEAKNYSEARDFGHYKTEAVTRAEAIWHFPHAFRRVGNFHDYSDERDWLNGSDAFSSMIVEYWCETNLEFKSQLDIPIGE